jgi:hypothetical protein
MSECVKQSDPVTGRPDTSVHWRKTAIITIFNCRTVQEIPNFYKFDAEYVPSPAGA